MNRLETALSSLSVAFQIVLCGFVFARKAQRVLPFFAAYSFVVLAGSVVVWLVYQGFGFHSLAAYYCYWTSILLNAMMRSLAIAELCRYKLRLYRGIWGLVWRVLAGISVLFLAHAAFDTWGQPNRLAIYGLTLDRDLAIASVAILAALLLVHDYYRLPLEPLQTTLAAGICLVCTVDIVGDTILRTLFSGPLFPFIVTSTRTPIWLAFERQLVRVTDIWSTVHLISFMAAIGIWCFALRKPIPESAGALLLPSSELYREMSPAINLRLRAFNDRLVELLKP